MSEHDVLIRLALPDDAAAVTAVLRASYPDLMAEAYDPELLALMLPTITRANPALLASGTYYLAEAEGEPGACGGWAREMPGRLQVEPGIGPLPHFTTRPNRKKRG